MIGKAIIGNSFHACVNYCLDPKKAPEILAYNNVFGRSKNQIANQFNLIAKQRPGVSNPVWHSAISFAHEDKVGTQKMLEIAKDYLKEMQLDNQQFLIVSHNDTRHHHCHLIINKIGLDGGLVRDWKSGYRTMKVMQELEIKYGLIQAKSRANQRKLAIAQEIEFGLSRKEGISQILKRVEGLGYEILYNQTSNGVIRGVSFIDKAKGICFKSSQIHRNYSYAKLLAATTQKVRFKKSKGISL